MPRMQLSDAEAAHIDKLRAKNAAVRGWNDALDHAAAKFDSLREALAPDVQDLFGARLIYMRDEILADKKPELIP